MMNRTIAALWPILIAHLILGLNLHLQAQSPSKAPTVVFVTGGDEYQSIKRMKPFAKKLEKEYGWNVIYIGDDAPGADTDPDHDPKPTVLPGAEQIKEADLMVVFMRFRNWEPTSLKMFMEHFEAGKPAVAIRTTTHAFWKDRTFSPTYFGGHYKTHYTDRIVCQVNPEHADHPMVRGVSRKWGQGEGPYVSVPLTEGVTPLVFSYGHFRDRKDSPGIGNDSYDSPNYPVAWAYDHEGARRAMITLGSYRVGDLKADYFQNLFYNSVFWALGYEVPEGGVLSKGKEMEMVSESVAYSPPKKEIPAPPAFNGEEWEMLFDGSDLSQWKHYDVTIPPNMLYLDLRANSEGPIDYTMSGARWKIENGAIVARPGFGDIITRQHYTNYRLRFDFLIPDSPDWVTGEWKGNSGVYLNGSWEISLLDTYGQSSSDRSNGAFYRFKAPDSEASRPAGQWQSMEVEFMQGVATVTLNGTVIHKAVKLDKPTFMGFPSAKVWPEESFPSYFGTVTEGPIRLQAENAEVRFANIALQRLYEDDDEEEEDEDE
ncbi:MAG: DUF1080 domain-containing protein [Bacteroidota bacterium]